MSAPELSVVVPVHDEAGNVEALLDEITAALRGRMAFEVVFVDDASRDGTLEVLRGLMPRVPELRVLRHARQAGQSFAVRHGVEAARAPWIATLDGDGQNLPADIPRLLAAREAAGADVGLFNGWRQDRRDTPVRRLSSRIANAVRRRWLGDGTPDSGCGIKLFRRDAYLDLPAFDHMHRFLPALFRRGGWAVESVPVGHRDRRHGRSKYGISNRLWVGIADLRGVAWLMRRAPLTDTEEIPRP